uniref:G-protein coupled receptors family 1 profile domain-containing protein n=1 Tax=Clytia hemisphaerica TaxID=252671 RepID=A0A7M5X755_9CNID
MITLSMSYFISGSVNSLQVFIPVIKHVAYSAFTWSNIALLSLAIDRGVAIRFPFAYAGLTRFVHFGLIGIGPVYFLYDVIRVHLTVEVAANQKVVAIGLLCLMLIMLSINIIVYLITLKQKAKIRSQNRPAQMQDNESEIGVKKSDLSTFYACFGCTLTFIVLWFPTVVTLFLTEDPEHPFNYISYIFGNINPISDAIFIVRFNKTLRTQTLFLLRKFFKRGGNVDDVTYTNSSNLQSRQTTSSN